MTQAQLAWVWQRKHPDGYECSSKGDQRFSAFYARMPDGRSIEHWYQCDIKGWQPGGTDWKLGKGQPPRMPYLPGQLYQAYLGLWRIWAASHPQLIVELYHLTKQNRILTDMFASEGGNHPVNQARALAQIINEWVRPIQEKS